jgi:hypothetical protein
LRKEEQKITGQCRHRRRGDDDPDKTGGGDRGHDLLQAGLDRRIRERIDGSIPENERGLRRAAEHDTGETARHGG